MMYTFAYHGQPTIAYLEVGENIVGFIREVALLGGAVRKGVSLQAVVPQDLRRRHSVYLSVVCTGRVAVVRAVDRSSYVSRTVQLYRL